MDLTFTDAETGVPRRAARVVRRPTRPATSPPATRTRSYAWRRDFQRRLAADGLGRACTGRPSTAAAARR